MSDTKLMIAIGILHLVALGAGGGLLLLAFRGGDGYDHPHAQGGRGPYQPPDPPRRPIGGPPLPSATQVRRLVIYAPVSTLMRFGSTSGFSVGVWPCTTILPKSARLSRNGPRIHNRSSALWCSNAMPGRIPA